MKSDINSNDILIMVDGEIKQEGVDYVVEDNNWRFILPPEAGKKVKVYRRKENGKTIS